MKLNYKGNSAVITGASGGMGLEISKRLSENNISVLMLDIKNPSKKFLNNNKNCEFKKVDVTNYTNLKSHIEKFYKKHKSIDYLVNTTGVLWFNKDISALDIDLSVWDKVFEINLKSMMLLSKIIVPKMIKNKFGSMVHISSIDALSGDDKPQDAYGASKAAIEYLSKTLSISLKPSGINVSHIAPGFVETPLTALNNFPMPMSVSVEFASKKIRSGLSKKKSEIHFPISFTWILKAIRLCPFGVQKLLIEKLFRSSGPTLNLG